MRVKDGNELADAIQSGAIPSDTGSGNCFRGKDIEENARYGDTHPKAGQPIAGTRRKIGYASLMNHLPDEWKEREVTVTGRTCWSWAGRGSAYEVVDDDGNVAWISCDLVPV